ncbi:double zinc ribbon domain-containing protein [Enterococcus sp.]|uniref:double zinc ribbon domain-containing protein n=1 Tax=Enterococcus sp. TaxID=35783 RepID=UPI002FCA2F47
MEEVSNVYCTNCGKGIHKNAEICTSCGVRQGKIIQHCYNCGGEINPNQEMCLSCGVNPKKVNKSKLTSIGQQVTNTSTAGEINVTLAAILGFLIPGLPSIILLKQKTKGLAIIIANILLAFIVPFFGGLILVILGTIDAYQLSKRVNAGEQLGEWTFFWDK